MDGRPEGWDRQADTQVADAAGLNTAAQPVATMPELRVPEASEVIELPIRAGEGQGLVAFARAHAAAVTLTASGQLALDFANGGRIVLTGSESLANAVADQRSALVAILNEHPDRLAAVVEDLARGRDGSAPIEAQLQQAEDAIGPASSAPIANTVSGHLTGDVAAAPAMDVETTRWGRDDLRHAEFGSRGTLVDTGVGTALPHLTGLRDEELGHRNGESLSSSETLPDAPVTVGVGAGIDHLWVLGDIDYRSASGDGADGGDVFAAARHVPKIWPPLETLPEFDAVEDTNYSGALFDSKIAQLPVINPIATMDPQYGTIVLLPDGTFEYTPAPGFSGYASFDFSFTDPRNGQPVSGTVAVTVEAVADAALVSGGATTNEDVTVAIPVSVSLQDPDGSEDIDQVVISGVPAGASLDWNTALPGAIVPQPDGSFVVTGSTSEIQALLQSLELTPPADFSGRITLDVAVTTIESNVPTDLPGYLDTETVHFDYQIDVVAVADNVTAIGAAEVTDEDVAVHLSTLAVTYGDLTDGSETHTVEIRGVDPDAKLTDSSGNEYSYVLAGDGTKTYTLSPADVGSVYFLPPEDESGTFSGMSIVAIATEASNADQATASSPITVSVNPVADPVDIVAPAQTTDEDTAVTFGDDIEITVNDPGSQTLTGVTVTGFPEGTRVQFTDVDGNDQDLIVSAGGLAVTLTGGSEAEIRAALATLTLTPPPNADENITLSISATTEDTGGVTDTQTMPMTIVVAAVADGPNVSGSASGLEDQPIDLPIATSLRDADGSETYAFAEVKVPSGVTLDYATLLPDGITVTVSAGTYTFTPGATTTAAQFENFLATGLQIVAPADSDVNFDIDVRIGTIESNLSGGEVSLLTAETQIAIPVSIAPVIDMPTVTGSSVVDEDTSVNFGANIAITENDKTDGSESITSIAVANIPDTATVGYTEVGGATVSVTTVGSLKTYTIAGGSEDDIRATLASFTLTPEADSDINIQASISITKVDQTVADGEPAATSTVAYTHEIAVAAVADGPTLSGSASGSEDQDIALAIDVSRRDADGSETYDFAEITVPSGVTLNYPASLPNGITVAVSGNTYTFTPGPSTTAAQFENFLADDLSVRAPADSDLNFNVGVRAGTIESNLSGGEVTTLRADETLNIPVTVLPVVDSPAIGGSSSVNEDGIVDVSDPATVAPVNFGANITISATDAVDGSEAISEIVISGLPPGAEVSYVPVGGGTPVTFIVSAGTTSVVLTGGTEAEIRTALASMTLMPPADSDANITLGIAVTKVDGTVSDGDGVVAQLYTGTHVITVAAVADTPTGSGSAAGLEDQNIALAITVGHQDASDGSETIKDVVIADIPAGFTLSESSAGAGTLTLNGDGTYTVTGPNDAAISDVLAHLSLDIASAGARQHLDTDFNLAVTVTTIESAAGAGQNALPEASTTFQVPVTVTAVADGVTQSGASTVVEDTATAIGADIAYSKIDTDGSESVTSVTVSGFTAGSTVAYTDISGNPQSVVVGAGGLSVAFTGGTEAEIRAALDTLTVTPPLNSDENLSLSVAVVTADNDGSSTTDTYSHAVTVQAVADAPSVSADAITLYEDTTTTLTIRADRSADDDNSETLSVRITVPSDGDGVIGTLSGSAPAGVALTDEGGGVYTVTATGATPADREALLDSYLNGGITFTPRPQWSGVLTGTNGIRVDAISTEAATGSELAPASVDPGDGTTKTETATTYIDITVAPVIDMPVQTNAATVVQENGGSSAVGDPDLVVAIGARIGLTIDDPDGSQALTITLTGFPTDAQDLNFATAIAGVTVTTDIATGTATVSGANANDVITVLNSLTVTLADDSDANFTISIDGTVTDSNGPTTVSSPFMLLHAVTVQAVADTPTVTVPTGIAAVAEDSGYITYPVTIALNDTDGSETYQSVVVTVSTPGTGALPSVQFGTTAGVSVVLSGTGQYTLTGSAADLEAAMASLQVRPGTDNGEDITVNVRATAVESSPTEDNNGAAPGMGGGVAGPEISVPTAPRSVNFTIPVNPVPEVPTLTITTTATGSEDTRIALSGIGVTTATVDADGSESHYIEIDTSSYPAGTHFYSGGVEVGTVVTSGWLRIPEADFAGLSIQAPANYSGVIDLSVRGVVVDASTSGNVTDTTATQTLSVTVNPVADGISTPAASRGNEDTPIAVGTTINAGIAAADNGTGTGNNAASETITQVVLDFPADTATLTYTVTPGAEVGSAQIGFNAATQAYTITSTIITSAADPATLSQSDRAQAEADIRATLAGFTVLVGPDNTDLNGTVAVSVTTLDVNNGLASTHDSNFNHAIVVRAIADTPTLSVVDPVTQVNEDGANVLLHINAGNSVDTDNSETLSVRITVPADSLGPVGTITGTPPAGVALTYQGNGVYLVTATGASNAAREAALDSFLNGGGIAFDPRNNWSGNLTGTNGIRVDVISTEAASGNELAPGSAGGADGTSKTETVTDYIDILVAAVADTPTIKGFGTGKEDSTITVPMSVTLADKDGSETYAVKITAVAPAGTHIYGAGGVELLPDGSGAYTLTPADVAALAVRPPANYSSAIGGDIVLTVEATVTDTSSGGTSQTSTSTDIRIEVVGVADVTAAQNVQVDANEDSPIALGAAIIASTGGDINNLKIDTDGSETLTFSLSGLPPGIIPTSAVPGGVVYLGNGDWSISADALATLQLPPVSNFSGENPYGTLTVRAVTQEIDGDAAVSAPWTVTIDVSPVIDAATVDGFVAGSWDMGATATEAALEAGGNISLASAANHEFVDNDGSESVISYAFDLSNLLADAGIAERLEELLGAGADLEDLVANYVNGTFSFDPATGELTVQAGDISGISLAGTLFADSNQDFSIPVAALVQDHAELSAGPVTVYKTETGSFAVDLVGTADTPTVFAESVSGLSTTEIAIDLGGVSTDRDADFGRAESEDIYYVVSLLNPGTAPSLGFTDGAGHVVGLSNGDGTWLLLPSDLASLHVVSAPGSAGTAELQITTIATENDGDVASNSTTFTVEITAGPGGPIPPPLEPVLTVGATSGNEDGSIALNVTVAPGVGDLSNPTISAMLSDIPPGAEVIGARYNPDTGRWVASADDINAGLVQIIPPEDYAGTMNITIEAVAVNAQLQQASTGQSSMPIDVDPVADGVAISAAPSAAFEDTPVDLNISLAERDIDGSETIGGDVYVRLSDGATLLGGYAVVAAGDPDATIDSSSLVGYYRVPLADLASLQAQPAANWNGDISVDIAAYSTETVDATPDADNIKLDHETVVIAVDAVADAPAITAPALVTGTEDTVIAIPGLSAVLTDLVTENGAEVLSIKISGVPMGTRFSEGSNNGDGSWTIPVSALASLTLVPPLNYSGTMDLTFSAISLELVNGSEHYSSATFSVVVDPKADNVELLAANATIGADGSVPLDLNVRMEDTTGSLPGENPGEVLQLTFSSVPEGVALDAALGGTVTNPSAGVWLFTGTEAQANALNMDVLPGATGGNYTIGVSAVTVDGADVLASAVTDTFRLTVPTVSTGTAANNILNGGGGTQILFGLAGDDTLNGGAGDDRLVGGIGADTLTGGTGADRFAYDPADVGTGTDTITDFTSGAGGDAIDISALLVGYDPVTSLLSDFVQIAVSGASSTLRVDIDGGGDSFQDLAIFQGVTGLDVNTMKTNGNLIV